MFGAKPLGQSSLKNDFLWKPPGEGWRRAVESRKCVLAMWALV